MELGPIHCGFQAKGLGVQGWAQWVGHLKCIHKELVVPLVNMQWSNKCCGMGRQSSMGGDGKVARCKHLGS